MDTLSTDTAPSDPPGWNQQQWLASIVESSPDMIVGETLDGIITSWNGGAERVYGYTATEAIGHHVSVIVPEDRMPELEGVLERLARGEEIEWFDTVRRTRDGKLVEVSLRISPVRSSDGAILGASAIGVDITQRRRAERELERQRAAARQYLEIAGVIFLVLDAVGRVRLINRKGCEILGYPEEEIVGQDWFDRFIPEPERETLRGMFLGLMVDGTVNMDAEHYENAIISRDGTQRIIAWRNAFVRDADGVVAGLVSSGEDVTERRASEEERRRLEREILEVSEQERRRIGVDLHDGLASHLSGLSMLARALADDAAAGLGVRTEDLEEIVGLAREGAEQARALARGLSPVTLEPAGLGAALRALAESTTHLSGIACAFTEFGGVTTLGAETVTQFYWIAREAVTNAVRHAGASRIGIQLCDCGKALGVRVRDDGKGMAADTGGSGIGIDIMRYRANAIGASLRFEEATGGGVRVTCILATGDDPNPTCHFE
jgi:PAS domain S-box-containing protein